MSVCVVTDPSAVIPDRGRAGTSIRLVPIDIAWDDGTLEPGLLPYSAIADRLARANTPPTTGAPSPGVFLGMYEEILATCDGVLVVTPSSDLSATYASAVLAAEKFGGARIRVLDAKTAAGGQGLVVSAAARTASRGLELDEVTARAVDVARRVEVWATLARLDFLRRSGRLPAIAAIGAGALGIQPVVQYAGGSPNPVGVVRSTRAATERLCRALERSSGGGPLRAVVFHSARDGGAGVVAERIRAKAPGSVDIVEVSAALAAHTGPGLLGVAWFWDN